MQVRRSATLFRGWNVFRGAWNRRGGVVVYVIAVVVLVAALTKSEALVILAAVVAGPVVYALSCWLDPWADCICCKGTGKHYRNRKNSTKHRHCRWCKRTGERKRWGRRIRDHYKRKAK